MSSFFGIVIRFNSCAAESEKIVDCLVGGFFLCNYNVYTTCILHTRARARARVCVCVACLCSNVPSSESLHLLVMLIYFS